MDRRLRLEHGRNTLLGGGGSYGMARWALAHSQGTREGGGDTQSAEQSSVAELRTRGTELKHIADAAQRTEEPCARPYVAAAIPFMRAASLLEKSLQSEVCVSLPPRPSPRLPF